MSLSSVKRRHMDWIASIFHRKSYCFEQMTAAVRKGWRCVCNTISHDDVIKWKHFPRYWPFVRGIHRPPVKSPHKGQWRGALMFSLICVWINGWVNTGEAGDLRRYRAHYVVIVMGRKLDDGSASPMPRKLRSAPNVMRHLLLWFVSPWQVW